MQQPHAPAVPLRAPGGAERVMKLFRQRLLDRLVAKRAISEELVKKLLAWIHPGFSAHMGQPIPFEDKTALRTWPAT